jgi:hypothetical protein
LAVIHRGLISPHLDDARHLIVDKGKPASAAVLQRRQESRAEEHAAFAAKSLPRTAKVGIQQRRCAMKRD